MTRYTVVWTQSAQDELAELWLMAQDRDAVTSAAHAIDQELTQDAPSKGQELHEGLRFLTISPLKVIFTASAEDRAVEVVRTRTM